MSDDLISREALIDYIDAGHLRNSSDMAFSEDDIVKIIREVPTAFDKKKVIEELRFLKEDAIEHGKTDFADAYELAIEIVEKGGIE